MVLASAGVGMVFALFRIVWLIVAAVFLYDLAVATGQFEVMKADDRRPLRRPRLAGGPGRLLVRGLHRGGAGFGAPVAISAAFLVGLGLPSVPVGLTMPDRQHGAGGLGERRHSVADLGVVTELDVEALSATAGRILPILSPDPVLAGGGRSTGWRSDARGLVAAPGDRRGVRGGPVPLVELRGVRAGRHRRVGRQHGRRAWSSCTSGSRRGVWRFEHDDDDGSRAGRPGDGQDRP